MLVSKTLKVKQKMLLKAKAKLKNLKQKAICLRNNIKTTLFNMMKTEKCCYVAKPKIKCGQKIKKK